METPSRRWRWELGAAASGSFITQQAEASAGGGKLQRQHPGHRRVMEEGAHAPAGRQQRVPQGRS